MSRQMKDSGVEWIGKIPVGWKKITLKRLVSNVQGGIWGEDAKNDENDIPCVRISEFDRNSRSLKTDKFTKRNLPLNKQENFLLKKGDLLLEKSGGGEKTPVGSVVLYDSSKPAIYSNFIARLRSNTNLTTPEYLSYIFFTMFSNKINMKSISQTIGIQNINVPKYLSEEIYIPSYLEQEKITSFLDKQTALIDAIIDNTKQSIEELKKYKQSLITQTVTKGLDKNVPMKDSGVEWIGEIPEHWDVVPNKFIMKKVKEICDTYNDEDILSLTMNGVIVRDLKNPKGKMPATFDGYQKLSKGNLLMCLFDIDVTPRCIGLIEHDGLTSPAYSQFKLLNNNFSNYYYYYYLSLDYGKELLHMSKNLRSSFTETDLGSIKVPIPPREGQVKIVKYLDTEIKKIDSLSSQKTKMLLDLDSYKKSLIYEYVTGKKEIKE